MKIKEILYAFLLGVGWTLLLAGLVSDNWVQILCASLFGLFARIAFLNIDTKRAKRK